MAVQLSRITGKRQAQPLQGQPANDLSSPEGVRQLFLASAIRESIPLTVVQPKVNAAAGTYDMSPQRFDVAQSGFCPVIRVLVHAVVQVKGGAAGDVTFSQTGPWSIIDRVFFRSPDGIERIDTQAYLLMLRRLMYQQFGYGQWNTATKTGVGPTANWTPVFQPQTLTTSGGGTNNDVFFWIELPLAVHGRDLQGLVDMSTPGRTARMTIALNQSAMAAAAGTIDDTVPFNIKAASAATVTLQSVNMYAQQYIFGLQGVVDGRTIDLPIPEADIEVVHEIATKIKQPIGAGAEVTEQLDINRTYITAIQRWLFNGQQLHGQIDAIANRPDTTAISKALQNIRFRYSANKVPIDTPLFAWLPEMYDIYGEAPPPGIVPWDFRGHPWNADWVDVIKLGATVDPAATVTGNTLLQTMTESLYTGTLSSNYQPSQVGNAA